MSHMFLVISIVLMKQYFQDVQRAEYKRMRDTDDILHINERINTLDQTLEVNNKVDFRLTKVTEMSFSDESCSTRS